MSTIQPHFWVQCDFTRVPEIVGVNRLFASTESIAGPQFIEGRVSALGSIVYSMSDMSGSPVRSSATIDFNDQDRYFRTLLSTPQNQAIENSEIAVYHQSKEGIEAGERPDRVFTGVVRQSSLTDPMGASLSLDDWFSSVRSPFNAAKKMLSNRRLTRDLFPQLHEDLINRAQRVIIGEQSLPNGAVLGIHVGAWFVADDGGSVPFGLIPTYMQPPLNLRLTVVGTPGTSDYTGAVSAITLTGETLLSTSVTIHNAPDILDTVNYVHWEWDAPVDAPNQVIAYRVAGRLSTATYITLTTNNGTYINPERTFDDGPKFLQPQSWAMQTSSTAVIQAVIPGPDFRTAEVWQVFFLCGHAVNPDDMHTCFGPEWVPGGEVFRGLMTPDHAPGDIRAPGWAQWQFPTPYVDVTDLRTGKVHRMTVMLSRGPRALYAMQGKAAFAWNMCGIETNGDGTGESIRKAFNALQWVASELLASNNGEGYYSGPYAGLPMSKTDPTLSLIDTDSIQQAQEDSIDLVGGIGYSMDTQIDEEISWPDFLTDFNIEYTSFSGLNRFGQFRVKLPSLAATHTGPLYRQDIEIKRMSAPEPDFTKIENEINFSFRYDFIEKKFIHKDNQLSDYDSQAAYYGGPRKSPDLGLKLIGEKATAFSAMARRRQIRAWQSYYQNWTVSLIGMRQEWGETAFLTHDRGLGVAGYEETPFMVIQRTLNLTVGEITLRGWYQGRYEGTQALALEDSSSADYDGFTLGDSTSTEPPPVGSYRLP